MDPGWYPSNTNIISCGACVSIPTPIGQIFISKAMKPGRRRKFCRPLLLLLAYGESGYSVNLNGNWATYRIKKLSDTFANNALMI